MKLGLQLVDELTGGATLVVVTVQVDVTLTS
jgi:hypothetical protein